MEFVKKYIPRSPTDRLAMTVTFLGIPFAFIHGILNVVPSLYPRDEDVTVRIGHYVVMVYLLVTVLSDLFLTMVTDPSCQPLTLPQMSQPGWDYCTYCNQCVPPRTRHCFTCCKCFLRRDHHCYFVGRCIGYQNHKYFMLFVFHTFITALYATVLSVQLVFSLNEGFSWRVLVAAILPVMSWMLQLVSMSYLVLIGTSMALLFMAMCAAMLCLHVWHLYNGQTYWESLQSVPQPKGWIRNAQDVLGSNWWLIWLSPWIPSPLPGDGLHYPPKETVRRPANNKHQQSSFQQTNNHQSRRKRV